MYNKSIICDPGTGYMKMGFAGDNFPKATFASLVGRPMLRGEENFGDDIELKVFFLLKKEIMIGN